VIANSQRSECETNIDRSMTDLCAAARVKSQAGEGESW